MAKIIILDYNTTSVHIFEDTRSSEDEEEQTLFDYIEEKYKQKFKASCSYMCSDVLKININ